MLYVSIEDRLSRQCRLGNMGNIEKVGMGHDTDDRAGMLAKHKILSVYPFICLSICLPAYLTWLLLSLPMPMRVGSCRQTPMVCNIGNS